ncbi:hypothetical protein HJC23_013110 [Cyclotella cryptica]|uniref:50S ribosomal protein L35 n=1 Tax=Cyclotella cryptica TaxID=29204 RepID=A0ABD3QMW9_9STRA
MFTALSRGLVTSLQKAFTPSLSFPSSTTFHLGLAAGGGAKHAWMPMFRSPAMLLGEIRGKCCLRTNKSAAKRFRVMGNGRIKSETTRLNEMFPSSHVGNLRNKAGKRHNTGHKGRARVNRLSASAPITEKSIEKRMRRLIAA